MNVPRLSVRQARAMGYICPHCASTFEFSEKVHGAGPSEPTNGSIGICTACEGWWNMSEHEFVKYLPTEQERSLVNPAEFDERRRKLEAEANERA